MEDYWETEKMGEFAYEQLGDDAFPLVYANNILVALGGFPDRDVCLEFVKNTKPMTKEKVLQLKKQIATKK